MPKRSKVTRKNPNALAATRRAALELGSYRVRVGWAIDLGADPETVFIAAVNALGAELANGGRIPPRDVLTPFIRAQLPLIRRKQRTAVLLVAKGKDPQPALDDLAAELERLAKQAVRDFSTPGNAQSTIDRKGFDNPLVGAGPDGGRLVSELAAAVSKR